MNEFLHSPSNVPVYPVIKMDRNNLRPDVKEGRKGKVETTVLQVL